MNEIHYSNFGGGITSIGAHMHLGETRRAVKSDGRASPLAGMIRPSLEGLACAYRRPHAYKGKIDVFQPGVFDATLAAGDLVEFRLSHEADFVVASTADRLELKSDERGLAFRLALEDDGVAEIVADRKAEAVSVGYQVIEATDEDADGIPYRLIKRAKLKEVSLVRRGAVRQTFARIVDAAKCGPLATEMKSLDFDVESAFRRLMRTLEDTAQ